MKKIVAIVAVVGLIATVLLVRMRESKQASIAIVVTLSHPALLAVRDGFTTSLQSNLTVVEYNAEGNMQQANIIAHKLASDPSVKGILAIGTLAAQTVARAVKDRPVVISAVSDPKVLPSGSNNVCGLTDAIQPAFQIDTISKLMPHIKQIALLYSPSEANSASMVEGLSHAIDSRALTKKIIGVLDAQQIMMASLDACQNADAVLIPLDNQLVAAMPSVIKATKALPCPIITSNESPIHQGATMAFGVDYKKSGVHAASLMNELINGEKTPAQIGIIAPDSIELFLNDRVIKEKQIALDENSAADANHVNGAIDG